MCHTNILIKDVEKDTKTKRSTTRVKGGTSREQEKGRDWYFFLQALFVNCLPPSIKHMYNFDKQKLNLKKSMGNIKQSIFNT